MLHYDHPQGLRSTATTLFGHRDKMSRSGRPIDQHLGPFVIWDITSLSSRCLGLTVGTVAPTSNGSPEVLTR